MAQTFHLFRPDDLLNLVVECENLRLDTSDPHAPALIPEDSQRDSRLAVIFPPQTVAETAFFEVAPIPPPPGQPAPSQPDTIGSAPPTVPVPARLGGDSRLVFRIVASAETRIPYSLEGLLDWAGFQLSVSPIADLPEAPSRQQISGAGSIQKPAAAHTAIELPYRLLLSPSSRVGWLHSPRAVTHNGRTELWHTRLALRIEDAALELSHTHTAPLRALWSPDYNATTPPPMSKTDPDLGITAMSPSDRHSVVVLTSAFHGYVNEDSSDFLPLPIHAEQCILSPLGGWLKSHGAWDPPYKWHTYFERVAPQRWEKFFAFADVNLRAREAAAPAVQRAEVPAAAAARDVFINRLSDSTRQVLIPSRLGYRDENPLNLSEWRHVATLGRDHYVRIVYEGHLYPFGHRAALIKVTERQIRHNVGKPLAYLVQHMFIVVREPVKDYTGVPADPFVTGAVGGFQHYDRYLPFRRIQLTTLVTPDIANPATPPGHIAGTDFSTWVMVNVGGSLQDFAFHAIAEDIAGNRAEFTTSLIFIPFSEKNRAPVELAYGTSGDRRACVVPEQKVTFAPRDAAETTDNTTLVTRSLFFRTQKLPFNKKYGGFLPELLLGNVRIPAIEQLLGRETTTTIALTDDFQKNGLVNAGGVFAHIVKEVPGNFAKKLLSSVALDKLPVTFQARQAGGVATPNMDVSCLSRKFGTLAGNVVQAAANQFKPSDFFPPGSARIFGVLDLASLIEDALDLTTNAPKTQITTEDIPNGKKVVTRLDWTPKVRDVSAGILTFIAKDSETDAPSVFTIQALLEKPVHFPPAPPVAPGEGTSKFSGLLQGFTLEFAEVIRINFKSFAFTAEAGKKMSVDVKLQPNEPVKFEGDLDFVEKLRELIPPGLLGDGPSLDINATRIRAGFAIGLPPAAVGVFALKDVSLSAALELPFEDGKPAFDFAFCERHHPFCLTVSLLGGGGFFHLQLDTSGIKQLEVALEFGACAALDIGVASGSVHIMAGIYFGMQKNEAGDTVALLTGYLRVGGEMSVLGIVSVSVEFNLSFTYYLTEHKCKGRATLTVAIHIAFFSKSIELSVERSFGKGGGDPTFAQLIDSPGVWDEYAGAFA